jgi:hypothetical protein
MRALLIVTAPFATAIPSLAVAAPTDDGAVEALPQREEIEAAGQAFGRVIDALLDVRIGPLAEAVDPERSSDAARRDETLRDMARRDDPHFEERMRGSIGAMTEGMSEMAARLAVLAPVLRETMADFERRIEDATRDLPDARDD